MLKFSTLGLRNRSSGDTSAAVAASAGRVVTSFRNLRRAIISAGLVSTAASFNEPREPRVQGTRVPCLYSKENRGDMAIVPAWFPGTLVPGLRFCRVLVDERPDIVHDGPNLVFGELAAIRGHLTVAIDNGLKQLAGLSLGHQVDVREDSGTLAARPVPQSCGQRQALRPPPIAVGAVAGGAGQPPAADVDGPGLVNLLAARDLLGSRRERPLEEQHMPPLFIGESDAERRRTVRRPRSEGRHCRVGPSAGHSFVHAERAVQTHLHHVVEVGRMTWQLLTFGADPNQ